MYSATDASNISYPDRPHGGIVASGPHIDGHGEVLVQVVDIFDHAALHRPGDRHVVEHQQVLYGLAQADPAGLGAYPNPNFAAMRALSLLVHAD